MSDPSASATGSAPIESPAQKQARQRRERRAAKLADGENRLNAITALQGGTHRDVSKDLPAKATPSASPAPTPGISGTATPDPDEIDISEHHYAPSSQPRLPSPFAFDGNSTPLGAGQAPDGQDPMMQMLQQMMRGAGGMPGMPGQPGGQPGDMPPGLANIFSAMSGGGAASEPPPEKSSAWIWRLVHAIFSFLLAVYIVLRTPFTGSKLSREFYGDNDDWASDANPSDTFGHFFYLFATFEIVLQTSRYYIERGQLQGSGVLNTVGQLLPEPYAGYVRVVGRYSVIYSTVMSDAMVVVFVLGAMSWWRGGAAA